MKKYDDVDYGPLEELIGTWKGDQGMDIAPEQNGEDHHPYYETIVFEDIGDLSNAAEQKLAVLQYRQIVRHKGDDGIIHDQSGYWHWDSATNTIMHSFVIPRAVSVVAGGTYEGEKDKEGRAVIEISAKLGDTDWSISQSPFMSRKASSMEFSQKITVGGGRLSYSQTTMLDIYGKPFTHTDTNELTRIDD